MDLNLKGRVAIVTGSGRGIGQAAATALAREGVSVVITDINPDTVASTAEDLSAQGLNAIGVQADVTDAKSVEALAAAALAVSR